MDVIETEGLTKTYGFRKKAALAELTFSVPEGGIFGFIGPNGSGKTTTMRCLLGLVRGTRGSARALGVETPSRLHQVIGRIGSFVESPTFTPYFSGGLNLEILATIQGIPIREVDARLDQVGLANERAKVFRKYSLGMKQRLGIAAALLKDPELLILDEPANGLDPAGVTQVREMLTKLGKDGRTIFLSSHNLSDVESLCDRVAIISKGKCVFTGELDYLRKLHSKGNLFFVGESQKAVHVLNAAGIDAEVSPDGLGFYSRNPVSSIIGVLQEVGIEMGGIRSDDGVLEEVFLKLTEGGDRRT